MPAFFAQVEDEWERLVRPAEAAQPSQAPTTTPAASDSTAQANGEAELMETEGAQPPATEAAVPETPLTPEEKRMQEQRQKLRSIIRGETSVQLYLEFLHSHNHADLQVLATPALFQLLNAFQWACLCNPGTLMPLL